MASTDTQGVFYCLSSFFASLTLSTTARRPLRDSLAYPQTRLSRPSLHRTSPLRLLDDWKELYEAVAVELKEKKLDVGQEKMLEFVLDMWDRVRPESSIWTVHRLSRND